MATAKTRRLTRRERRAAAREAAKARAGAARAANAVPGTPGDGPPAQTAPRDGAGGTSGLSGPFAAFSRRDLAAVLALVLLVAASYFPALSGGFVWDDRAFTREPVVHRWSGLWNIWLSPGDVRNEGHYWPLVYTTFWLLHESDWHNRVHAAGRPPRGSPRSPTPARPRKTGTSPGDGVKPR